MPRISEWGMSLTGHYPNTAEWPAYREDFEDDVRRFIRLWLTEGIPYAFQNFPMIFEAAREDLARGLRVSSKDVNLAGSARIGYSLRPDKFGLAFQPGNSDFDFFIVSEDLFGRLRHDGELWLGRFCSGLAKPRTNAESNYWPENAQRMPVNLRRGFIDSWMLPRGEYYEHTGDLSRALETFQRNLNDRLPSDHRPKKSLSVRVYRCFESAVSQMTISLVNAWTKRQQTQ